MNANIHIDKTDVFVGNSVRDHGETITFDIGARSGGPTGEKWEEVTFFIPRERLLEMAQMLIDTAHMLHELATEQL